MHPPLKHSLSTTFLMIPAFVSSVNLISNEDKVKMEEEVGFFNKLKFKVY